MSDIDYDDSSDKEANATLNEAGDEEYDISDVLSAAKEASLALQNYYSRLSSITEASKTDDGDVAEEIQQMSADVEKDLAVFRTYKDYFSQFDDDEHRTGEEYYDSLEARFINISDLISSAQYVDETKLCDYINSCILNENQLIATSKQKLINFLEYNDIEYTDNGSSVEFTVR